MCVEKINNNDFDMLTKYGNYFSFTIETDDGVFPCITNTYQIIKIYGCPEITDLAMQLENEVNMYIDKG